MPEQVNPRSPEQPLGLTPEQVAQERVEAVQGERPRPGSDLKSAATQELAAAAPPTKPAAPLRVVPPLQRSVEAVLEEGLEALYRELSPSEQLRFKSTGEEVASQITELIQRLTVKLTEVLQLIRRWLLTIPGINRHFLEQAAKIKADKILKLR